MIFTPLFNRRVGLLYILTLPCFHHTMYPVIPLHLVIPNNKIFLSPLELEIKMKLNLYALSRNKLYGELTQTDLNYPTALWHRTLAIDKDCVLADNVDALPRDHKILTLSEKSHYLTLP